MDTKVDLQNIDAVILCGGLGTRLRPVLPDRPKCLAPIKERTFLDILLDQITGFGFKKIILCVGYLKEHIKKHRFTLPEGCQLVFSEENKLLGTGGALLYARPLISSDPFIVFNGDSICRLDLINFFNFHILKKGAMSIVVSPVNQRLDAGNVRLSGNQQILDFHEKGTSPVGLINAGIYLMGQQIFAFMPQASKFSLEYDLFPSLLSYPCFGFLAESDVIDIGTVERYNHALEIL